MAGFTVFILEQLPARRVALESFLGSSGYRVHTGQGAEKLLSEVKTVHTDLIILDIDPPNGSDMAGLKALHDFLPSVPIIVQTSSPSIEGAVEAMRRGAYNYLAKDLPLTKLLDVVSHALEKERLSVEAAEKEFQRKVRSIDQPEVVEEIDRIILSKGSQESSLIACLQDIQKELNYLPHDALRLVAMRVGVNLSRVYSIATFYKSFSLSPRGRHLIHVCLGTACHVRGGARLLESFERELGVQAGGTTYDNRFTLESVRCLGCCGLAPVVMIDNTFYGKVTQDRVRDLIDRHG